MPLKYSITISPRAIADLNIIHAHVSISSPQSATSLIQDLFRAIDRLNELPHPHAIQSGRRKPSQTVRRVPVHRFVIYFRIDEATQTVNVLTVRHGSRQRPRRF
jgi:plasmid stabilization system protein ParE